MARDEGERTEEPTPKRREDARRRGEVAQSRDVASVLVLGATLGTLAWVSAAEIGRALSEQARLAWGGSLVRPGTLADFHALLLHHGIATARALAPPLLVATVVGSLASLAQVGPLFSTQALAFRSDRIDPVAGLGRMFSPERLFELAKTLCKLAAVTAAGVLVMRPALGEILSLAAAPPAAALAPMKHLVLRFAVAALLALGAFAALDLAWVRLRQERKLRMTRREVRDELREREGSPQQKSRMRQIQRDLSRQRMIAEVAKADVVVTNPSHYAVALRYAAGEMSAPQVLAKGRNHVALRIRETARQHGVPVFENPPLARLLYRTARVGHEVPASLYRAVAEVLAYVYRLDARRAAAWRGSS